MIEVITMLVLFVLLIIMEFRQEKLIRIKANTSKFKIILALMAAIALIALFWSKHAIYNYKIILLALVFLSVGIFPQGLGQDKVITYGSIMSASEYIRYDQIIFETISFDKTMVTFASQKGGSYSLTFNEPEEKLRTFLNENISSQVKLVSAVEYDKERQQKDQEYRKHQQLQINAIRNRSKRNQLPWKKN